MADYKQTVVHTKQAGYIEDGPSVDTRTKRVHTESSAESQLTATNIILFILGVVEVILGLRLLLKLLGANPNAGFVDFIYTVSGVLSAPFDSIFNVHTAATRQGTSVFEPSIIVAMAVYALIAWGIIKLINLNRPTSEV